MSLSVNQIIAFLHQIAPPKFAEHWDNVGLQIGGLDWKVNKIRVALDPIEAIVERACYEGIDLLITHHPLFLSPLLKIDVNTARGRIISLALENHLTIFSAHTNFDSVLGGVNDILADKIGLMNVRILRKESNTDLCKLVVFAPANSEKIVLKSLFSAGAGQIGAYSCCSFRNEGVGTFLPGQKANPHIGTRGNLSEVKEIRIESVLSKEIIGKVIDSISKIHPYETVPYDIYPITTTEKSGIGRIGELKAKMSLSNLTKHIKTVLNLDMVKVSGNLDTIVESVAVCSGSGSATIQNFFASGAQTYVSGDISYHNARSAQDLGLTIIDLGHFHSEQIAVVNLAKRLKSMVNRVDKNISVSIDDVETDVFRFV